MINWIECKKPSLKITSHLVGHKNEYHVLRVTYENGSSHIHTGKERYIDKLVKEYENASPTYRIA